MSDDKQPVAIELIATQDRKCINVVLRSDENIPLQMAIDVIGNFMDTLKAKFPKPSAIQMPPVPKILL